MDLTQFSTDDLVALKAGDLSRVSTAGLRLLKQSAFQDKVTAQQAKDRAEYDPTKDMGPVDTFLAGTGKAMTDLYRGAKQRLGLASQDEIDQARALDAPLMRTGAGKAGAVAGSVASALPAVLIPGANAFAGASAIGAVQGLLQPTAEDESAVQNALVGGALGAGGVAAGRALRAGYEGAKGLVAPFTEAGRTKIVGRTLDRFAANPDAIKTASTAPTITGAVPTTAEATRDTGLATLQRAVEQLDPAAAAMGAERTMANNAARVKTLEDIAGGPAKRAAAVKAREDAAGKLYSQADVKTAPIDAGFQSLMDRPAFSVAVQRAEELAKNEGIGSIFTRAADGSPNGITGKGAHYVKKALDDMADKTSASYMGQAAASASGKTQKAFLDWLDNSIPEYRQAASAFADASKPINAMDVGQRLVDKTTSATRDMAGNRRMQANAFAKALNDEEQLMRLSTGTRASGNALADVMTPDQLNALGAVRNELELAANLGQAANGPGSQTAKSLASQNMLRQILGPTGLPQSWAESTMAQTAMRPVQWALNAAEPRITAQLSEALLDPAKARAALEAARANPALAAKLKDVLPLLKQAASQSVPAAGLVSRQRAEQ